MIVEAAQGNPELAAVAANPAAVEALAGAVQGALAVRAVTASTVAEFADSEAAKILDDAVDKAVRDTPQLDALPPEAKRHAKQDLLVVLESNFVKGDQRLPLLTEIPAEQRDAAAAVLAMRSSEAVGRGLIRASWVLVGATAALVIATAVLGYITASPPANNTHVTVVVPAASPSK